LFIIAHNNKKMGIKEKKKTFAQALFLAWKRQFGMKLLSCQVVDKKRISTYLGALCFLMLGLELWPSNDANLGFWCYVFYKYL
jgi:hypothetical protein